MRIKEYEKYLLQQGLPEKKIRNQIAIIGDFVKSLADLGFKENIYAAGKMEVDRFMHVLIRDEHNTPENISSLSEYSDWIGCRKLYTALIEVMDCYNALEKLAYEIEKKHGREMRSKIFNKALPPLGADEIERCAYTQGIMKRIAGQLSTEEAREAWFNVQHGLSHEFWNDRDASDIKKYRQCGGLDEFLDLKRQERDANLTKLRDDKKLWYTTEITDEVLEFIKKNPEIEAGRREGDSIYITKVPYNAVRYLNEKDNKLKRYYACHCPLVRDAIFRDHPVSPDICNCSLGHASHYLAGSGMKLKGEVLESVIKGDMQCRFIFYLQDKNNLLNS